MEYTTFYNYYMHVASNLPVHRWWYTQSKDWFSHRIMDMDEFQIQSVTSKEVPLDQIHENWVIWWDQIMRHPFHSPITAFEDNQQTARTKMYPLIYELAKHLLPILQQEEAKIFMLLAIRHDNRVYSKRYVVEYMREWIEEQINLNHQPSSLQYRFFHASLKDLMKINLDVLDIQLPTPETDTCLSTKYSILASRYCNDRYDRSCYRDSFYSAFEKVMNQLNPPSVCVSLSGGVDSMVLATCAIEWATATNRSCCLLHIQYNNRNCCEEEVAFLRDWVSLNFPDTPLIVRSITELRRKRITEWRVIYESITREYRFQAYQLLGGHALLGHNYEDTIENVLTNLTNGTHWKNLKGMSLHSIEQNVSVYRPFLNVSKENILAFAHQYRIPYLEDSTPSWSKRGQLRDCVIPALKQFDKRLLSGLATLSDKLSEHNERYHTQLTKWLNAHEMPVDTKTLTIRKKNMSQTTCTLEIGWRIPYDEQMLHMEFWNVFLQRHQLSCSIKSKQRWIDAIASHSTTGFTYSPLSKSINGYCDHHHVYVFITS